MTLPRRTKRQRRDPRAERGAAASSRGGRAAAEAAPRARTCPRAVRLGAPRVDGRLRIDRARPLHVVGEAAPVRSREVRGDAGPRRVRIPEPVYWVLAVPDCADGTLSGHDRDMLGAARRLADAGGGAVVAMVAAGGEAGGTAAMIDADTLGPAGADRVMRLEPGNAAGYTAELRAAAVLAAVEELQPRHVVLPEGPTGGGEIGRRLASSLGEMPATHVVTVEPDRVTSRGDGGRTDYVGAPPRVVLVEAEAAEPVTATVHEAASMPAPAPAEKQGCERGRPGVVDCGVLPVDAASVPLAEAELILSGGAGITDWDVFHALAAALGASEAGSRVACDAGALPRERQVGASGTRVSARGYIALGISGAPQHLEGIKRCEHVIAVNTDRHAEIVERADLAVIGDAGEIMRALLQRLEAEKRHGA